MVSAPVRQTIASANAVVHIGKCRMRMKGRARVRGPVWKETLTGGPAAAWPSQRRLESM